MNVDTRTQNLPTDARAVLRELERLAEDWGADSVPAGFNPVARACVLTRDRTREMIRLLQRRGFIAEVEPADPGSSRPACYRINRSGAA